jgi:hypothetical protein
MAGQGKTTFVAGTILTASQVNGYLMDQVVQVYAGTAARGSALPVPDEGMMTYLADTDKLQLATGTATYVDVYPAVPLTGSVLQVVTTRKTDTFSTTSTSLTDVTGLSASITPSATANNVLVTVSVPFGQSSTVNVTIFSITDGSNNNLINASSPGSRTPAFINSMGVTGSTMGLASFSFVHSPSTTSSFTYKVRAQGSGGATVFVNRSNDDDNGTTRTRGIATITLMEIKG